MKIMGHVTKKMISVIFAVAVLWDNKDYKPVLQTRDLSTKPYTQTTVKICQMTSVGA